MTNQNKGRWDIYAFVRFRAQTIMNITFGKLDLDYLWIGFKIIYGGLDSVQGPKHSQGF